MDLIVVAVLVLVLLGHSLRLEEKLDALHAQGRKHMALSDEVRAFVENVKAGVEAAVADIHALHEKVDAALEAGDIPAARAALAEGEAALGGLAEAVAIPEDPPAPEPEA